jgi:hypothetical protein
MELHDLFSLPVITRAILWRKVKWAEHVARMAEKIND